jgi:cob(I)alamin adenosyltransferase
MGNRLSKIYTKTGDDGSTGMADGSRVSKADLLFEVMGDVDELNSNLGLVKSYYQLGLSTVDNNATENSELAAHMAQLDQPNFGEVLQIIQHLLFNLGGELAMPEYPGISETHTTWLEQQIDAMNAHLPPLKDFILPTGSVLVSQLHIARCVCRRAERHGVALRQSNPEAIRATALAFINRLSDWLFVASRFCCAPAQRQEVLWDAKILQDL